MFNNFVSKSVSVTNTQEAILYKMFKKIILG